MEDSFASGYAVGRDSAPIYTGGMGGFGGMNGWGDLAALIVVAGLFGWGNGGFGANGGAYSGIANNYALATDFATIERKIDGVNAGLCDGFYATAQGINGVQQTLCQGFSGVNLGITQQGYETRNAITDVGYALRDCCCTTQRAIDGVNYNLATQFGALNTTICGATRDIIDSQTATYRALHDELVATRMEAKNERIAELQAQVAGLQLKASQEAQNAYLLSELKPPCPTPSYVVPNPNCCYNASVTFANPYATNVCC